VNPLLMPGSVLHVRGESLEPAVLLHGINLNPYQQNNANELRSIGPRKGQAYGAGGFSLLVSDVDGDLSAQIQDAISFLAANQDSLSKVLANPAVDDSRLDFGYNLRISDRMAIQCDYLPPELLRLAGEVNIGIELSLYPT